MHLIVIMTCYHISEAKAAKKKNCEFSTDVENFSLFHFASISIFNAFLIIQTQANKTIQSSSLLDSHNILHCTLRFHLVFHIQWWWWCDAMWMKRKNLWKVNEKYHLIHSLLFVLFHSKVNLSQSPCSMSLFLYRRNKVQIVYWNGSLCKLKL
jgi:hypothetical protein